MAAPKKNKNSTADKRIITSTLRRVVTQNPEKLRSACEKILRDAVDGNLPAFSFIADRLEGKPAQSHTLANEEGETFKTEHILREIIDAKNTDR